MILTFLIICFIFTISPTGITCALPDKCAFALEVVEVITPQPNVPILKLGVPDKLAAVPVVF